MNLSKPSLPAIGVVAAWALVAAIAPAPLEAQEATPPIEPAAPVARHPGDDTRRVAVDLYWLPLGAGGHSVRVNGRVFEAVVALLERRAPLDLYHSALIVEAPSGRYVIEQAPASRDGTAHGVVREGAVGARLAGRFRLFRYEVRCWPNGRIPDLGYAVGAPHQFDVDHATATDVLRAARSVPSYTWGRDVLSVGDMWNSNSVVAFVLATSGIDANELHPPGHGRAPGWRAGVVAASQANASTGGHEQTR